MSNRLYLDHNASSPARPEAIAAMTAALEAGGNSSAPHGHGRTAGAFVANGRDAVGLAMGVCAQDLIFTGTGTEGINTAVYSAVKAGCQIFVSAMDHPASLAFAQEFDADTKIIPAGTDGLVDLDWLEANVSGDKRPFVSIAAVNSETGIIQDVERAIEIVQKADGLILVDAVQALGKLPMFYLADYIAVSAHKIGGPQGVGALYIAPDAPFTHLQIGGGQEQKRRAGTINAPGIAGFGAAAAVCENDLNHTKEIRDAIESGLKSMEPDLVIFGENSPRVPNTSLFAVPDTPNSTLMMSMDLEGISISTGMACSSGKVGASRAVTAMNRQDDAPKGALRLSLGYSSRPEDADRFLTAWAKVRRHSLKGAA